MIQCALNQKNFQYTVEDKIFEIGYTLSDHARALYLIATEGKSGETYNVRRQKRGQTSFEVVGEAICEVMQKRVPGQQLSI